MNKIISLMFLLIASLFLAACAVEDTSTDKEVPATEAECQTNNDCVKGGCSGTICQSKDTEPIMTTCEWLPGYACYKGINCACINGKCQWEKTEGFDKCVEKAKLSGEIIV